MLGLDCILWFQNAPAPLEDFMMDWEKLDLPTLVMSFRSDPKTIAMVAQFMTKNNNPPQNKAHIGSAALEFIAKFGKLTKDIVPFDTNAEALDYLASLGITWPVSSHGRDLRKTLQWDVMADMSVEDALAMKQQIRDQRKKGQNLMPSAVSSSPKTSAMSSSPKTVEEIEAEMAADPVWDQLEELDRKLRGKGDGD